MNLLTKPTPMPPLQNSNNTTIGIFQRFIRQKPFLCLTNIEIIIKKTVMFWFTLLFSDNGALNNSSTVKANKFTKSAIEKIEAAGGKAEVI